MGNIPAQRGFDLSLANIKAATVRSPGQIATVASSEKMARLMIKAFNIRNRGYATIGGHLFPRGRR